MLKKLREPVNSLTHWGGAALALIGLIALLVVGWDTPAKVISLAVYGVSLIFLFSASATYHMVRVKDKALEIFRKIDHSAIYVLIAGTYTPFCVNAFTGFWKWGTLSVIWSLAAIGIAVKIFYIPTLFMMLSRVKRRLHVILGFVTLWRWRRRLRNGLKHHRLYHPQDLQV